MLALAVGVLVLIDIIILSIYFVVEGTSGSFTPDIKPNEEHFIALLGVSFFVDFTIPLSIFTLCFQSQQKLKFKICFMSAIQRAVTLL